MGNLPWRVKECCKYGRLTNAVAHTGESESNKRAGRKAEIERKKL
jgi:hypothetical protein